MWNTFGRDFMPKIHDIKASVFHKHSESPILVVGKSLFGSIRIVPHGF